MNNKRIAKECIIDVLMETQDDKYNYFKRK